MRIGGVKHCTPYSNVFHYLSTLSNILAIFITSLLALISFEGKESMCKSTTTAVQTMRNLIVFLVAFAVLVECICVGFGFIGVRFHPIFWQAIPAGPRDHYEDD
jgi:hypothetical protein